MNEMVKLIEESTNGGVILRLLCWRCIVQAPGISTEQSDLSHQKPIPVMRVLEIRISYRSVQ